MNHIIELDTTQYAELLGALAFRKVYIEKHELPHSNEELARLEQLRQVVRDAQITLTRTQTGEEPNENR